MPNKIILDNKVIEDTWEFVQKEATDIPEGLAIIPSALWSEQKTSLSNRDKIGVWLDSDESPKLIADDMDKFDVIAINFPAFADGRGFSYARELRETHHYQGQIRAIGSFMRDQLFYLKRCGFNAFAIEDTDIEQAIASLNDFSDSYQASIDQPQPLFQRR